MKIGSICVPGCLQSFPDLSILNTFSLENHHWPQDSLTKTSIEFHSEFPSNNDSSSA